MITLIHGYELRTELIRNHSNMFILSATSQLLHPWVGSFADNYCSLFLLSIFECRLSQYTISRRAMKLCLRQQWSIVATEKREREER